MFVVFEGIDGSGKSTQSQMLYDFLSKKKGGIVMLTKEPTGGEIGKFIREVLSGRRAIDAYSLALLFTADRYEHLKNEIAPAVEKGSTVICDRYYHSTIAYQSAQGVDRKWLMQMNAFARIPDVTFYFDVDVDYALKKVSSSEFFEREEMLRKIKKEYESIFSMVDAGEIKNLDDMIGVDMVRIDGMRFRDEVFKDALRVLSLYQNR